MPRPKKLDPNECRNLVENFNGTDSAELTQYPYNGSLLILTDCVFKFKLKRNKRHSL